MKKLITKSLAIVAFFLFSVLNLNAVTYHPITTTEEFQTTDVNIAASDWVTYTKASYTARTKCYTGNMPNLSATDRFVNFNISGCASFTINADGNSTARYYTYSINGGTPIQTAAWPNGCTSQTFNTGNTGDISLSIAGVNGSVYLGSVVFTPPANPLISAFSVGEVDAIIDQDAKTIVAELPFGSSLAAITPTVTIGGTATGYSPAGVQDFTNSAATPIVYTATDGVNNTNYAVTLTASTVASSDKDLSDVLIGGMTPTFNAATNAYNIVLPKSAGMTQAVTFTKPISSTANFISGNTHDFGSSLSITVTAQDLSTKVYTLSAVNGIANIAYVTTNGMVGTNDTKVYPALVSKGYYVDLINATGSDLNQFNSSDLVILTEEVSSGNTLAVAMGALIDSKPFLNFKAYMYSKLNWPTGAGSNGLSDAVAAIASGYELHPIFTDVAYEGTNVSIFTTPAVKGLQGVTTPGAGSIVGKLTSTGNEGVAGIIESNGVPSAKYMMIGLANDSYGLLNASGLKLIENAVSYLLGTSKFTPVISGLNQSVFEDICIEAKIIVNKNHKSLQVWDTTGRLIKTSTSDIDMSSFTNGIYILKSQEKMMKIMLSK